MPLYPMFPLPWSTDDVIFVSDALSTVNGLSLDFEVKSIDLAVDNVSGFALTLSLCESAIVVWFTGSF